MNTMRGLKSSLGKFMPEADTELKSMTDTLGGLMSDSLTSGDAFNMESDASSEETDKILQEASAVAEQQVGDKFPSVPASSGISSRKIQARDDNRRIKYSYPTAWQTSWQKYHRRFASACKGCICNKDWRCCRFATHSVWRSTSLLK